MTGPARRRRLPRRRSLALGLAGLVALLLVRSEVAAAVRVDGHSMAPTLRHGDVVLVEKLSGGARRGDLVTFRSPVDGSLTLKRVAGVAGDAVEIRDGRLRVDGREVDEPYVDPGTVDGLYVGPVSVAAGTVLVLGDNRGESVDSRAYGAVPLERLTGRVVLRLWPPRNETRRSPPWGSRGTGGRSGDSHAP